MTKKFDQDELWMKIIYSKLGSKDDEAGQNKKILKI